MSLSLYAFLGRSDVFKLTCREIGSGYLKLGT